MTEKPCIYKSRIADWWYVETPESYLPAYVEIFKTWQEALLFALELAGKAAKEPPC